MSPSRSQLHRRVGYWGLAATVLFGLLLEAFLAWKRPEIVDAGVETRRLLLRLAHAHAAGLALINVVFGFDLGAAKKVGRAEASSDAGPELAGAEEGGAEGRRASTLLLFGSALVPIGFALGGAFLHGNDPGMGILFVPLGALMLFVAFASRARSRL